jgi:hypothetical protein
VRDGAGLAVEAASTSTRPIFTADTSHAQPSTGAGLAAEEEFQSMRPVLTADSSHAPPATARARITNVETSRSRESPATSCLACPLFFAAFCAVFFASFFSTSFFFAFFFLAPTEVGALISKATSLFVKAQVIGDGTEIWVRRSMHVCFQYSAIATNCSNISNSHAAKHLDAAGLVASAAASAAAGLATSGTAPATGLTTGFSAFFLAFCLLGLEASAAASVAVGAASAAAGALTAATTGFSALLFLAFFFSAFFFLAFFFLTFLLLGLGAPAAASAAPGAAESAEAVSGAAASTPASHSLPLPNLGPGDMYLGPGDMYLGPSLNVGGDWNILLQLCTLSGRESIFTISKSPEADGTDAKFCIRKCVCVKEVKCLVGEKIKRKGLVVNLARNGMSSLYCLGKKCQIYYSITSGKNLLHVFSISTSRLQFQIFILSMEMFLVNGSPGKRHQIFFTYNVYTYIIQCTSYSVR